MPSPNYPSSLIETLLREARSNLNDLGRLEEIANRLANLKGEESIQATLEVGNLLAAAEARQAEEKEQRESAEAEQRRVAGVFVWPSTDAPASTYGFAGEVFFYKDGLLKYVGYTVGQQGQPESTRRLILDCVFHNELPRVHSPEYMQAWGRPMTDTRLRKMAESIAAFTRNAKRNTKQDYSEAIGDWESDLAYLHRQYYLPMFEFVWPNIQ